MSGPSCNMLALVVQFNFNENFTQVEICIGGNHGSECKVEYLFTPHPICIKKA
jgi:hypothetical protein